MKQSQKHLVLVRLKRGRTITPMEAFQEYHITRLAAIIHSLRHEDKYVVEKETVTTGKVGHPYARYKLNKLKSVLQRKFKGL